MYVLSKASARYHRLTSSAFNDVAKHDVEWGERRIEYLDDDWDARFNYWKDPYLCVGLTNLRKVIDASTFDDRCHILKALEGFSRYSLFEALKQQDHVNGLTNLQNLTIEDERVYIPAQLAIDGDKGPEEAWRWAYAYDTHEYWYGMSEQGFLRERGYVMWDSSRLAQWGLLNHDWDDLPHQPFTIKKHCYRLMEDSFKARHKIWCRGGRGWWSPGDESRITWPPSSPSSEPIQPKRPKTVAPEAIWGNMEAWITDMKKWRENLKD